MQWFWYFLIYSFFGFLIEVTFARVTGHPKRDRKCRFFLPICPVYGLGAMALLLLPEGVRENLPLLFLSAAAVCTAVEYGLGLFYERVAGVHFWDYSRLPLNLGGRVCLLFTLFWGILAVVLLNVAHPWVERLAAILPQWAAIPLLIFNGVDAVLTLIILRRSRTTDSLRWHVRPGWRAA